MGWGDGGDAEPALGRHPLRRHAAWDVALTGNSQMPWQLMKAVNANCINSPCARTWTRSCIPSEHLHFPATARLCNHRVYSNSRNISPILCQRLHIYSAGRRWLLLNKQDLIDRKIMQSHLEVWRSLTHFSFRACSETLLFCWPRCLPVRWICFKLFVSRMLLATQHSPRGTTHKNNWLITGRNTSNHNMAVTHSEERLSQWVRSTDGWRGKQQRTLLQRWSEFIIFMLIKGLGSRKLHLMRFL